MLDSSGGPPRAGDRQHVGRQGAWGSTVVDFSAEGAERVVGQAVYWDCLLHHHGHLNAGLVVCICGIQLSAALVLPLAW